MSLYNIIFLVGKLPGLFDDCLRDLGLSNVMEQTADGSKSCVLFAKTQPSGKDISDQGHIHTMNVGGVIIFPHAVKHIK